MDETKHSTTVFFVGYLALFCLIGLMLWPFLTSIIFACILAGTFNPLAKLLDRKLGSRKRSAAVVCLVIVLAIILPSLFIILKLFEEVNLMYQNVMESMTDEAIEELLFGTRYSSEILQELFQMMNMEFSVESIKEMLLEGLKSTSTYIIDQVSSSILDLFSFIINFFIMLVVIFTLLVEGSRIKEFFLALSPLPDDEEELVIEKFNQINYVTLVGNGIGGVIQGILAGIGFGIAGLESIALWTTLMVVLAFIPLVGISIIFVPACCYLWFWLDQPVAAVILFAYCLVMSQIVENWFKPRFVGSRVKISSALVFLSIIGGLSVFGVAGIFYGPLIISIFLTFVELYHKRYTYV